MLSSCLDTDEVTEFELGKNCQIHEFSLSSDSVPGLSQVKFTIDQLTGRIFNMDSMPFGTKVEKVVCKVKTAGAFAVTGIEVTPEAYKDSTYYMKGLTDSIDFSAPVKFVVHAYDGVTTKVYNAQINIHQVQPDTMLWKMYVNPMLGISVKEQKVIARTYEKAERYFMYVKPAEANKPYALYHAPVAEPKNWKQVSLTGLPADSLLLSQLTAFNQKLFVPSLSGALYQSTDGLAWSKVENTPFVKSVLGSVAKGAKQTSVLATIVEKEGVLSFYAMDGENEWIAGDPVSDDFPVSGFGSIEYNAMFYHYLSVSAGRSFKGQVLGSTWSTMNGLNWSMMSDNTFPKREGAIVFSYDEKMFLLGGVDGSDKALKDIYQSIDYGVNWSLADSMLILPPDYAARGFSSVQVDKENYVNIFGGKTNAKANDLNQLWRGRINRLIPKE